LRIAAWALAFAGFSGCGGDVVPFVGTTSPDPRLAAVPVVNTADAICARFQQTFLPATDLHVAFKERAGWIARGEKTPWANRPSQELVAVCHFWSKDRAKFPTGHILKSPVSAGTSVVVILADRDGYWSSVADESVLDP
jgi:hypothetical protein